MALWNVMNTLTGLLLGLGRPRASVLWTSSELRLRISSYSYIENGGKSPASSRYCKHKFQIYITWQSRNSSGAIKTIACNTIALCLRKKETSLGMGIFMRKKEKLDAAHNRCHEIRPLEENRSAGFLNNIRYLDQTGGFSIYYLKAAPKCIRII